MARRYGDPVEVRPVDGCSGAPAPAQFLWRGRLYVVREILAHWVETGAWWRSVGSVTAGVTDPAPGTEQAGRGRLEVAVRDEEHELWRVEASAGRTLGSGVFDLRQDARAGCWSLAQVVD